MAGTSIKGGNLSGLRKYLKEALSNPSPGVKVGVLGRSAYPDGENVAQNLARHEFGTSTVPARAPFRKTVENKKADWAKEAKASLAASSGDVDIRAALVQVGDAMAMDIQNAFNDGLEPELKKATIKRKTKVGYGAHADKPVLLTGMALRTIESAYVEDLSTLEGKS